jgi:hypothetical protein
MCSEVSDMIKLISERADVRIGTIERFPIAALGIKRFLSRPQDIDHLYRFYM